MLILLQYSMQKAMDYSLRITPKMKLQGRKVMLSVWLGRLGIILFKFLNFNQTLNVDLYSQQLPRAHRNLPKNASYTSIGETLSCHLIMQGHIQQESRGKKYWL